MSWWFKTKLWQRVIVALILGVAFGLIVSNVMGQEAATAWLDTYVRPVGLAFVNLIRMLIVPLIFTTLVAGVVAMGDPGKLRSLGFTVLGVNVEEDVNGARSFLNNVPVDFPVLLDSSNQVSKQYQVIAIGRVTSILTHDAPG